MTESGMNPKVKAADRRYFLGGSDARIIMGGSRCCKWKGPIINISKCAASLSC
jgi:hypothetical protein